MKSAFLDRHYPKIPMLSEFRQGTLSFAIENLRLKRLLARHRGRSCNWRLWSFRHPVTGRMYHTLAQNKRHTLL